MPVEAEVASTSIADSLDQKDSATDVSCTLSKDALDRLHQQTGADGAAASVVTVPRDRSGLYRLMQSYLI